MLFLEDILVFKTNGRLPNEEKKDNEERDRREGEKEKEEKVSRESMLLIVISLLSGLLTNFMG